MLDLDAAANCFTLWSMRSVLIFVRMGISIPAGNLKAGHLISLFSLRLRCET